MPRSHLEVNRGGVPAESWAAQGARTRWESSAERIRLVVAVLFIFRDSGSTAACEGIGAPAAIATTPRLESDNFPTHGLYEFEDRPDIERPSR